MKLMILDGNSVANRAYYGVRPLSSRSGQPTGAIYGFLTIMQSLLDEEAPDALAVAFDERGATFRHLSYEGYKAARKPLPDDLSSQLPILKEILKAMNIPMYSLSGWEADDIMATIGRICGESSWDCVAVTGDRDVLQLADAHMTVKLVTHKSGRTNTVNYTPSVFEEEYGFPPKRLIDYKALAGDASDNYPGVPGIGEKTAKDLLGRYGSLDAVYAHLEDESLKPAVRRRLTEGKDTAYLSYDLAAIRDNAPLTFVPEENTILPWDRSKVLELFQDLDFGRFIEKYQLLDPDMHVEEIPSCSVIPLAGPHAFETVLDAADAPVSAAVSNDLQSIAILADQTVYTMSSQESDYFPFLKAFWNSKIAKVCHDSKSLQTSLLGIGIRPQNIIYDTALASYLLNPNRAGYPAGEMCQEYCSISFPENLIGEVSAIDALFHTLPELVQENGMEDIYQKIDFPLCSVLAEMEHTGIAADQNALSHFSAMLSERIADCENLIYGYAGGPFNINSTKQLGTLLFEKLSLPHGKKSSRGYSTNIDVLESIRDAHPIVPAIIDYRMLTKLHSTYAEGLLKVIGADGRIHTTFQNMVTATGRLSSTDPNLQNIPVRTELGGEIRKMFVPAEGCVLVDADYSQIELRVLAHIADDTAMQDAFLSGDDFHAQTAALVFGVPAEQVTPQMRRSAKAVNFGIIYGISDFSLAGDIGVTRKEAREYIDSYLNHFQGVRAYMKNVVEAARETGYVETLYGRRRALPDLKSSNYNIRTGAERMALNTPIQGTAADIMKLAMLRVHRRLAQEGLRSRLVLQVHDELLLECPEPEAEAVMALTAEEMESAASLRVPLLAEVHSGKNWYEAK